MSSEADVELREKVGDYFDRNLAGLAGHPPEGMLNIEKYRSVFSETAIKLFGENVLELTDGFGSGREYNPLLYELGSMLTSLEHNAGVYYPSDDVEELFGVVAEAVFGGEEIRRELVDPPRRLSRWKEEKTQAVSSLDREVALPLVRDASGAWRVVDKAEYGRSEDFKPLEVLRQDNSDKGGWNKYRFRNPTYTRQQDLLHTKPVADGWFTSEWYAEPNYWSARMRKVLAETAHDIGERLSGSNTKVLFSTEGGIFKGTGAANTDLDTSCKVICDSAAEFETAHQAVIQELAGREKDIPFRTKKVGLSEMVSEFYDRSTGMRFMRTADGNYRSPEPHQITAGQVIEEVRRNEQGLLITTPRQAHLFRKPKALDGRKIYVAISSDTGDIRQLDGDPRPKPIPAAYYDADELF